MICGYPNKNGKSKEHDRLKNWVQGEYASSGIEMLRGSLDVRQSLTRRTLVVQTATCHRVREQNTVNPVEG